MDEKRKLTFLDASAKLLGAQFVANRSTDCNEILYWRILQNPCHAILNLTSKGQFYGHFVKIYVRLCRILELKSVNSQGSQQGSEETLQSRL
jgi:hypothetical protein